MRRHFNLCNITVFAEFPAVLVDLKSQIILSEFHHYIQPIESPQLSEFCTEFTGITQEKIDHDAVPLQTGLLNFGQWLNESIEKYKLILPKVGETNKATTAFMTWTDWDFGVCLTKECERKRIKKSTYFDQWIDLKATFKVIYIDDCNKFYSLLIRLYCLQDWYKYRPKNFADALTFVGMYFEGRQHSGIDDSRNIARLACRLVHDGAPLAITKNLTPLCK